MKKDLKTSEVVTDDILEEEILKRLPAKVLVRFKSVSKQWKSMIEASYLAEQQLVQYRTFFLETISIDDRQMSTSISLSHLRDSYVEFYCDNVGRIVGCCDGIVCIYDLGHIYLINPTLRRLKILSPATLRKVHRPTRYDSLF